MIRSFAFTISFQSHTSHARSFINQLRAPFLVRDIKVNRSTITDEISSSTGLESPFGEIEQKNSQHLPIVKDVKSTFSLLVEYIYEIDRDFETFVLENIKSFDVNEDVLKLFLEETGNSKLLPKIQKILKKVVKIVNSHYEKLLLLFAVITLALGVILSLFQSFEPERIKNSDQIPSF